MLPGILDGALVLDFTIAVVGPFCSRIMADMGAEVIQVERPSEEPERYDPEMLRDGGGQMLYLHCNGGKKNVCVNMKDPRGLELVQELARKVDIVVENYTPGVLASYGLDFESLKKVNPKVIMCSMTGYGQTGWNGNVRHPCTDPVAQAMGGLNNITGEHGGAPYTIGGGIGDTITAMQGALAVGYALFHRERTGRGQHIDLAMMEGIMFADSTVMPYVGVHHGENIHYRNGKQNTYTFPMGVLKAKDGYIALQAVGKGPASGWARLARAMGREDMIDDPRYDSDLARLAHRDEVVDIIESWLQEATDDEAALAVLAAERISSGPVLSQEQLLSHPKLRERGAFKSIEYPELGPIDVVEPPYHFSDTVATVRGPSPQAGEHNLEVLTGHLGLSAERVSELTREGVLIRKSSRPERSGADPSL